MLEVSVESTELETRNKKNGEGQYQLQTAYVHTFEPGGKPKRYPEEIKIFPPRDPQGNVKPYQKGNYIVAPHCLKVDRGFLTLGFVDLIQKQK